MSIIRTLKSIYLKAKLHDKALHINRFEDLSTDIDIRIAGDGNITLKGLKTDRRVSLSAIDGTLSIGDNVFLNRNCIIVCRKSITIGKDCSFGPNVVIYDHDHKFSTDGFDNYQFNSKEIRVEDGCWIGANVTLLKGAHIGHHSIIGAGTVINMDIPPHSIVTNDRELHIHAIEDRG